MNNSIFTPPKATCEIVKSYAPQTKERAKVQKAYQIAIKKIVVKSINGSAKKMTIKI